MNVNWTRITPVCVPPVTYSFTNRTALASSSLTQFCSSLPVRPSQQDWAPTKVFHRLDSASSSLRLVFPGVFIIDVHRNKRSVPCLFCSVSGQNVGEFLIFKYETISLPSVQMCLFLPWTGVWPWDNTEGAVRRHREGFGERCSRRQKLSGFHLRSHKCWEDLYIPRYVAVPHVLKRITFYVKESCFAVLYDWCHLVVDRCNSNKHIWLWVFNTGSRPAAVLNLFWWTLYSNMERNNSWAVFI